MAEMELIPKWTGVKEGYIDSEGNWVIDPIFDVAEHFQSNGLARVCVKGLWGVINMHGGWIVRPKFAQLFAFEDGLALFRFDTESEIWGYIDTEGRRIPGSFRDAMPFSHGVAFVSQNGKEYGLIDRKGNWLRKPVWSQFRGFDSDGFAEVESAFDGEWSRVDTKGRDC